MKDGTQTRKSAGWRVPVVAALAAVVIGQPCRSAAVCASVKIEIKQTVTLERQAFDAMMKINNGFDQLVLSNLTVQVQFTDSDDQPVSSTSDPNNTNALFYIRVDTYSGITSPSNGVVNPLTTAEIHWLIIPAPGAGGTNADGRTYNVGATLQYRLKDTLETVDVAPDSIDVQPMPRLRLDYFLPRYVYGDDPYTAPIEERIPFPLGVRVKNSGAGPARSLKIESAQPEIVENVLGLLVGFDILGSEVQGETATRSLLADFGTVDAGASKVARWIMTASLMGRFTGFEASFTHADELGGQLTSLMESVLTHTLIKDVLVDLPGRDRVRDFLANDSPTIRVYESEGQDTVVTYSSNQVSLAFQSLVGGDYIYQVTLPPTNGFIFAEMAFPAGGAYDFISATRQDGKVIDPANAWIARERAKGTDPWNYSFRLFDVSGGGTYRIVLRPAAVPDNRAPVLAHIGPKVTFEGQMVGFLVEASDPDGTTPTLSVVGAPPGASFVNTGSGQAEFTWQTSVGDYGVHPMRFMAGDGQYTAWEIVRVYVGHQGEALDAQGRPVSLSDWDVEIRDVFASATSGNATVRWDTVEGLLYEVYVSDGPLGPSMVWNKLGATLEASNAINQMADSELGTRDVRFYRAVLADQSPNTNKVWAVIRKTLAAAAYTLVAPPVRTDRQFGGAFGSTLAEVLNGSDDGIGGAGDEVYALRADGSWNVLYLDSQGVWRNGDGSASTLTLDPGQGIWVARQSPSTARLTFTGPVGNDGSQTNRIVPGWNIIGLSQGQALGIKAALQGASPAGGASEEQSDLLILQNPNGSWRRMMYVNGWGAPYDGNWFDLSTFQITTNKLEPGAAYYYYRLPSAGQTNVRF